MISVRQLQRNRAKQDPAISVFKSLQADTSFTAQGFLELLHSVAAEVNAPSLVPAFLASLQVNVNSKDLLLCDRQGLRINTEWGKPIPVPPVFIIVYRPSHKQCRAIMHAFQYRLPRCLSHAGSTRN